MKIIRHTCSKSTANNLLILIKDRLDLLNIKIKKVSKNIFSACIFIATYLKYGTYNMINYIKNLKTTAINAIKLFKKTRKYEISLLYTLSRNYFNKEKQPWMNQISDNIYLGGILLKNKNHLTILKEKNIGSVLSLLEPFEYTKTFFSTPVTKKDLNEANINLLQIQAKDFIPLTIEEIDSAVNFLKDEIAKSKTVYVHCKAGKGRSVMAVCGYLIAEKTHTASQAIEYVREKRCNINLNKQQTDQIDNYQKEIEKRSSS